VTVRPSARLKLTLSAVSETIIAAINGAAWDAPEMYLRPCLAKRMSGATSKPYACSPAASVVSAVTNARCSSRSENRYDLPDRAPMSATITARTIFGITWTSPKILAAIDLSLPWSSFGSTLSKQMAHNTRCSGDSLTPSTCVTNST
jgi:hypothetical protein